MLWVKEYFSLPPSLLEPADFLFCLGSHAWDLHVLSIKLMFSFSSHSQIEKYLSSTQTNKYTRLSALNGIFPWDPYLLPSEEQLMRL